MRLRFRSRAGTLDAGEFKETEHPRGPDGKFTSGAAGGKSIQGGVAFPKAGSASNKIWQAAHQLASTGKVPTAAEVAAHLEKSGHSLNKATINTQFNHYKKWAAGQKKEEPAKETLSTAASVGSITKTAGFKKEGTFGKNIDYYQKDVGGSTLKVSYSPEHETWQLKKDGEKIAEGKSDQALKGAIMAASTAAKTSPAKPKSDPHSTTTAKIYASAKTGQESFTSHGISTTSGLPEGIVKSIQNYTGLSTRKSTP